VGPPEKRHLSPTTETARPTSACSQDHSDRVTSAKASGKGEPLGDMEYVLVMNVTAVQLSTSEEFTASSARRLLAR